MKDFRGLRFSKSNKTAAKLHQMAKVLEMPSNSTSISASGEEFVFLLKRRIFTAWNFRTLWGEGMVAMVLAVALAAQFVAQSFSLHSLARLSRPNQGPIGLIGLIEPHSSTLLFFLLVFVRGHYQCHQSQWKRCH